MLQNELQNRIEDLKQQIAAFPPGSITKKKINGKDYFYRRWTEDKKRKEKYWQRSFLWQCFFCLLSFLHRGY